MYIDPQNNNKLSKLILPIKVKEEIPYHQANKIAREQERSEKINVVLGNMTPTSSSASRIHSKNNSISDDISGNSNEQIPKDELQILKEQRLKEVNDIVKQQVLNEMLVTVSETSQNVTVKNPLVFGNVTSGKYQFNDFQILRTLGTGSFGRVHLVRSNHNGRYYTLKILNKKTIVKYKQVEHTNDERKILSVLSHPFIVKMWGTFQDAKHLFIVMDFVEGGELFSLLKRSKRFPSPVAKFYAAEIVLVLEYLHSNDIIYRDLKPENILLDRNGHIKVVDFGFAKYVPDVTYTLCGTPDYIAPEVINTKAYNKSVDWWSLGILIYEMLAGVTPFTASNPVKTYENILSAPLTFPSFFEDDAINLLSGLINRDLSNRLGNLKDGTQDVKNHPWFSEVIWEKILQRKIETPYEPPVKSGQGDTSQFDRYPEDEITLNNHDEDIYGDVFKNF